MARAQAGAWVGEAWSRHLSGESIASIAKDLGRDERTVSRHLKAHAEALAASRSDGVDPGEYYVQGLLAELKRASAIADDSAGNARVGACRLCLDIRRMLAQALGVALEGVADQQEALDIRISVVPTQAVPQPAADPRGYAGD